MYPVKEVKAFNANDSTEGLFRKHVRTENDDNMNILKTSEQNTT